MLKYILKRLGILLLTLFIVVTITFFLMKAMKGTPFNNPKLSPDAIAALNVQYGLDKPQWQQYLLYLKNVFTGDLGTSFQYTNQSVTTLIVQRLGISAQLGLQALVLGVGMGLIVGALSARHQNDKIDGLLSVISTLGYSVPSFILAVFLFNPFAVTTRFVRSEMIEALNSDYIQLARAKGLTERQVANHHAYRNSMIPVLTLVGPMAANLLTGSVLIERIFSIPGIGEQFVNSIPSNDYPVIMGTTIVYAVMLMSMILLTDIVTSIVDPRVRLQ